MRKTLVLTLIGPDRPGLVDSLSEIIADNDADWLESRMSRLAGKFAGILCVTTPPERVDGLNRALRELEAKGLKIIVESSEPFDDAEPRLLKLEIMGHDRQGIVKQISRVLAQRGANVEELVSRVLSAPMSGELMFSATFTIKVEPDFDTAALGTELERVGSDLMVDITVADNPSAPR